MYRQDVDFHGVSKYSLTQENYRMGGSFQWPNVHDVLSYRDKVRGVIDDVIDNTPLQLPVTHDSPWVSGWSGCDCLSSLSVITKHTCSYIPYSAKFSRHLYFVDWPLKTISLHNVRGMTAYRKPRL